jgi:diguanylate cyclase (GGDEF)-like protein
MTFLARLPFGLLMIVAALIGGLISIRAYRSRRQVRRAAPFAMMAFCGSAWMLLAALDTLLNDLFLREILWWLIPFAMLCALTGLFFFSLEYTLRLKKIPKAILFPIVIMVVLITALSATNYFHHLLWTVSIVDGRYVQNFEKLFLIQLFFTYLIALSSLALLIRAFLRAKGILKRQTALLLLGLLIPITISILTDALGWNPLPYLDEAALSILFTIILFARATLQFNLFYLLPIASDVIIRNMQDGVLVTDIEGLIIYSNPAIRGVLQKTENKLEGIPVSAILTDWIPEAGLAWQERKEEAQLVSGDEESQYFRLTLSKLTGSQKEDIGYLLTIYNTTDQVNLENRLNELAIRDPLTGCYNRRYFYEMASAYFNQMLRNSRPLAILMLDLDHFKLVNDTYGHQKGDDVLQKVAGACKKLIRTPDIFSRHGGEEFVLAMPETTLQNAVMVAERLRKAIEALKNETEGIQVTVSIGVVESTGEPGLSLDALLERADRAMYMSKNLGRNRVTAWERD